MSANANKSLNCYSHHAPKMDWFIQFFNFKDTFDQNHSLGSQMYSFFKRFLRDAELLDETGYSNFASVVNQLGLDNLSSWALMLTNLAYTPQINWLIKRVETHETVSKDYTLSMLVADGAKESWVGDIWNSYSRILDLPFSEVGLGIAGREKNKLVYAALLLKHISSAFDSNQRSMFDFIKNDRGDEIKGFQWFIDNFGPEDDNPLLTVDMLWEFL